MKQIQTAGLFKKISNNGQMTLIFWSITLYLSYLCSALFLFITPSIDVKDIYISLILFLIFIPISYLFIKTLIKKELSSSNADLKPYIILSFTLILAIIVTFVSLIYNLYYWLNYEDYSKNLVVKRIMFALLPTFLIFGLVSFFIIKLKSTFSKKLSLIIILKLLSKMVLVTVTNLVIGVIVYIFINISFGGFPFG